MPILTKGNISHSCHQGTGLYINFSQIYLKHAWSLQLPFDSFYLNKQDGSVIFAMGQKKSN